MDNERLSSPLQIGNIIGCSQELQNLIADFGLELINIVVSENIGSYSVE